MCSGSLAGLLQQSPSSERQPRTTCAACEAGYKETQQLKCNSNDPWTESEAGWQGKTGKQDLITSVDSNGGSIDPKHLPARVRHGAEELLATICSASKDQQAQAEELVAVPIWQTMPATYSCTPPPLLLHQRAAGAQSPQQTPSAAAGNLGAACHGVPQGALELQVYAPLPLSVAQHEIFLLRPSSDAFQGQRTAGALPSGKTPSGPLDRRQTPWQRQYCT